MQKIFTAFWSVLGIMSLQVGGITAANAQEDTSCFMVNSRGRKVDLSALCGSGNPTVAPEPLRTGTGVYTAKIKRRENGIPVIDVLFSGRKGKQKFEMIVDTGASGTVITGHMANALGVVPVSVTLVNTASERGVRVPLGYVSTIEVNGAIAQDIMVAIQPALDIGLLGHDFFDNYEITVKKDVVEFRLPSK